MNFDTVTSMRLDGNAIVLETTSGRQSIGYPTLAAAGAALRTITLATGSSMPGGATLVSISPNSVPAGNSATLVLTGTNLLPSAQVLVGTLNVTPALTYLSGTTIQIFWESEDGTFLGAGTYNVAYTDAAGGSATLVAGFTVS